VDYLTPQLYWPVARKGLSYPALLDWWAQQNTRGRHLWPGLNAHLAADTAPRGRGAEEILDQVRLTRERPGAPGEIFFSEKAFVQDPDSLSEKLVRGPYAAPAIVPASPWLDHRVPAPPRLTVRRGRMSGDLFLDLHSRDGHAPWLWVIQTRGDSGWTTLVLPGSQTFHILAGRRDAVPTDVRVRAVSRTGMLSRESRADLSVSR
jgi:hypothetical protein